MHTEQKNTKRLKELYNKALTIKSAIPHPRILGIIRECGGKMHMHERSWSDAATDFFEVLPVTPLCLSPAIFRHSALSHGPSLPAEELIPSTVVHNPVATVTLESDTPCPFQEPCSLELEQ